MHQVRSSAVGTGRPSCPSACWMDLVIPSLGSDKVPSRSKQITFMESSTASIIARGHECCFRISRRVRSTSDSGKVAAAEPTDVEGRDRTCGPLLGWPGCHQRGRDLYEGRGSGNSDDLI